MQVVSSTRTLCYVSLSIIASIVVGGGCLAAITLFGAWKLNRQSSAACPVCYDDRVEWQWQLYRSWPVEVLCIDPVNEGIRAPAGLDVRDVWLWHLPRGQILHTSRRRLPGWSRASTWSAEFAAKLPDGYSAREAAVGWPWPWCAVTWDLSSRVGVVRHDGFQLGSNPQACFPARIIRRGAILSWAGWSLAAFGIGAGVKGLQRARKSWRARRGLCGCGYDMRGLDVCPECGSRCVQNRPSPRRLYVQNPGGRVPRSMMRVALQMEQRPATGRSTINGTAPSPSTCRRLEPESEQPSRG